MRPFAWRIVRHTVPVLLALLVVAWATRDYLSGEGGYKLGVDLVGGTILVYEVDPSKKLPDNYKPEELAASLKRRIDPADLYNVTIRPVGQTRIEIILPTGGEYQRIAADKAWKELAGAARDWLNRGYKEKTGKDIDVDFKASPTDKSGNPIVDPKDTPTGNSEQLILNLLRLEQYAFDKDRTKEGSEATAELPVPESEIRKYVAAEVEKDKKKFLTSEDVKEIKELISRVGALEFRILANTQNDGKAITAAQNWFKDVKTNEAKQRDLANLAAAGQPPPPPENPEQVRAGAANKRLFDTPLGNFTYSWVELGPAERHQEGLDNSAENDAKRVKDLEAMQKEGKALSEDDQKALYRGHTWQQAKEARDKGEAFLKGDVLIWSRDCKNVNLAPAERDRKRYEYFVLTRDPEPGKEITGKYLTNAAPDFDRQTGQLAVAFAFDDAGANLFRDLTSANKPKVEGGQTFRTRLAIVLDGLIMSAPTINTTISGRGQITGNFDQQEVDQLVRVLRAGALPATLFPRPVSENTISPTLGEETVRWGAISVGVAFLAVLIFMLIYYRFAGMVACVALLANLILTVAFMVLVKATFTLPGLAGLVLMLGMAVDANVLIYERLREERDRGATLALAIRNGYDRAFPAIIDTHLTSIFTAVVLYVVGNDQLKGFGISLTSGLIISLWTSLYMTRTIFDLGLAWGWIKELRMMRFLTKVNINFMAIRNYMFAGTVLLSLAGAALFAFRVSNGGLNIDFVGGTAYRGQLAHEETIGELRKLLGVRSGAQDAALRVEDLQEIPGSKGTEWRVTYAAGQAADVIDPDTGQPRTYEKYTRTLLLAGSTSAEDLKRRLQKLDDLSVEQVYDANAAPDAKGSRKFNVRTTEKDAEIVLASIDRLLGDKLKKIDVNSQVRDDGRTVELDFFDPQPGGDKKPGEVPAFASPSTIRQLVIAALVEKDFKDAAKVVTVEAAGDAADRDRQDRRTSRMIVHIPETARMNADQVKDVMADVKASLAHQPEPEAIENFDSALAQDMQQRAMWAILASWGAILLYLWFRFGNWTFGAAAVLCLVHDLLFTLGAIALCHYLYESATGVATILRVEDFKIDLPAVAALLTLVGYSVNDTIVVFDRIREVRGKSPELTFKTINDSVNQTLSRTILTSFITWLVVAVLYVFGGEGVHLFAFVMVIGVIVGTYSSIYIAAPLLIILGEGRRHGQPHREEAPTAATAE